MVRDARNMQHPDVARWAANRLAEAAPTLFWQAPGVTFNRDAATAPASESVRVYANEGRWIAECPDCHGAQLAARVDRRFMCHCCGNVAVGGLWRPVVWPAFAALIEAILDRRRNANANWIPGETVADLEAEDAFAATASINATATITAAGGV